ncbi:hypothetical protein ACFL5A_00140 [Gemmatimonadota bacterium]
MPQDNKDSDTDLAREVLDRAVKRLDLLEYLILFFALVLALAGGALVGWILQTAFGFPFRWGWAGASLLLFVVPGAFVYLREFRHRDGPAG